MLHLSPTPPHPPSECSSRTLGARITCTCASLLPPGLLVLLLPPSPPSSLPLLQAVPPGP